MDYSNYLDERGYPGTRQSDGTWDGGDTAAILGTILALARAGELAKFSALDLPLYFPPGVPARHWDKTKWYGQPDRFSRDQLIAVLCGSIEFRDFIYTATLFKAHKKRWFLTAWNTQGNDAMTDPKTFPANLGDICGPEVWALWIRLLQPWWAPLVLWFLDLQTLIGAIQWRWFTDPSNQITRNHMLVSLAMIENSPSPTTWLVKKINNWADLVGRWRLCNAAVGECPTADLFEARISYLGL